VRLDDTLDLKVLQYLTLALQAGEIAVRGEIADDRLDNDRCPFSAAQASVNDPFTASIYLT
jgi:hypothetical protein